jgi:hypothetical protein
MRKPARTYTNFYVRIDPASERLRRKLTAQLGDCSQAELVQRALQALAAEISEKHAEKSAAA